MRQAQPVQVPQPLRRARRVPASEAVGEVGCVGVGAVMRARGGACAHARRADGAVAAGVGRGAPGLSRASRLAPKGIVSLRLADGAVDSAQRLAVHQRRGEEVRRRVLHCYYNFCIIAAIIGVIMIVIMMIIITIMCG